MRMIPGSSLHGSRILCPCGISGTRGGHGTAGGTSAKSCGANQQLGRASRGWRLDLHTDQPCGRAPLPVCHDLCCALGPLQPFCTGGVSLFVPERHRARTTRRRRRLRPMSPKWCMLLTCRVPGPRLLCVQRSMQWCLSRASSIALGCSRSTGRRT